MEASSDLPKFRKIRELTGEERQEREYLVKFCLTLAKAILQTSVFTSDHPQAIQGIKDSFEAFSNLSKKYQELSFIVTSWLENETLALDNVFEEPIPLGDVIGGTMGEAFGNRLHTFCTRNRLVSFAIKNTIAEDEYQRFVNVFVERNVEAGNIHLSGDAKTKREAQRFTNALLREKVVNVTVVMQADLLESKRRVPWRVRIAMARLKKDLRMVPIFSQATETELRQAKTRLLGDILRPLRRGNYLKDLFVNLDLISEEVAELDGLDLEPDLLGALTDDRVIALGSSLIEEKKRVSLLDEDSNERRLVRDDIDDTVQRQLEIVSGRISEKVDDDPDAEKLLVDIWAADAVDMESLPDRLQEQVFIEHWSAKFLAEPDDFLRNVENIEEPNTYLEQVPILVSIFPELIAREELEYVQRIVEMLDTHRKEGFGFRGRPQALAQCFDKIKSREVGRLLVKTVLRSKADVRGYVIKLFAIIGLGAIPPMVRIINETDRPDVLEEVCLTLSHMGLPGAQALAQILDGRGLKSSTAKHVLTVLAKVAEPSTVSHIKPYSRHPEAEVRDAALQANFAILKQDATTDLLKALSDSDSTVVRRAIGYLSRIKTRHRVFVEKLLSLIDAASDLKGETPIQDDVTVAAIRALGRYGNVQLGSFGTVEEVLIGLFDAHGQGKMQRLFRKARHPHSETLRLAICDVLEKIGSPDAVWRLEDDRDEPASLVRTRMAKTALRLRDRWGPEHFEDDDDEYDDDEYDDDEYDDDEYDDDEYDDDEYDDED